MTAVEAADAIADGWHTAAPGDDLDLAPMSDGGPGFVDVLRASLGGRLVTCTVRGPRDEPVPASFLVVDGTAYVESAQACGLHLVPEGERDPGALGTAGVGELLARAGREADRVVVGLGGSGTNDGGAGLLQAIGWGLYDGEGRQLSRGGTALAGLARVEPAGAPAAAIVAASDVDNPLLGLEGATATYGPQKGASADDVQRLDAALRRCADVVEDALGRPGLREKPGAGAAGGLGFALLALGGTRESGVGTGGRCHPAGAACGTCRPGDHGGGQPRRAVAARQDGFRRGGRSRRWGVWRASPSPGGWRSAGANSPLPASKRRTP